MIAFIHSVTPNMHSFIQAISLAPLQVHYYSEALPTQHGSFTPKQQALPQQALPQLLALPQRTHLETWLPAQIRLSRIEFKLLPKTSRPIIIISQV